MVRNMREQFQKFPNDVNDVEFTTANEMERQWTHDDFTSMAEFLDTDDFYYQHELFMETFQQISIIYVPLH